MPREDPEARERRLRRAAEIAASGQEPDAEPDEAELAARTYRSQNQGQWVDFQIRQAMERGEFDDLPSAGKPLRGIGTNHDPDWWIKGLIERERITGVLPPALALRKENLELDDRIDREATVDGVRHVVDDFNARIVEARRQLQGGPPVITPLRDLDAELAAWRSRRAARVAEQRARLDRIRAERDAARPTRWWRRGR